ncbi:MAG TPA: zinc-dependent metalloprotease, partial [Blastocatellia bacterium]|nr:zinc-dependent metalloprotease [Blastocatellia bacterium]
NQNAFTRPAWALKPEILERIQPTGALERVRIAQQRVLANLLSEPRLERLIEQEAMGGHDVYTPSVFLGDVRKGVWSELASLKVHIEPFRADVQYSYLDLLAQKIDGRQPVPDIQRSLIRSELRTLSQDIVRALPRATDRETRAHLEDARDEIARALDPKFILPANQQGPRVIRRAADGLQPGDDTDAVDPLSPDSVFNCWPDYSIKLPNR